MLILIPLMKAKKAGLDLSASQLEKHFDAGGDVDRVVDALVEAKRLQIPLEFEQVAAIDLMGRDILQVIKMQAKTKII